MEAFTEEYGLQVFDDEPMVMGRNSKSVSFMEPLCLSRLPSSSASAVVHGLQNQLKEVRDAYKQHGPFLVSVSTLSEVHIDSITTDDAVNRKLASFITVSGRFRWTRRYPVRCFSYHLLVRRPDVTNLEDYIIEPITDAVGLLLQEQLMKAEWKEQVLAYKIMARSRRTVMGWPRFRSDGAAPTSEEVALDLVPMKRQPASGNSFQVDTSA